jgi:hypothetical protein
MEKSTDPKDIQGSPRSAEAESNGEPTKHTLQDAVAEPGSQPTKRRQVNVNQQSDGESQRNNGLLWPMLDEYGGGRVRITHADNPRIARARRAMRKKLLAMPEVKRQVKKLGLRQQALMTDENLELPPGARWELNRYVALLCVTEWVDPPILKLDGENRDPEGLPEVELRALLETTYLPPFDLGADTAPVKATHWTFLMHLLEGMAECADSPSSEIGRLGKAYVIGRAEGAEMPS